MSPTPRESPTQELYRAALGPWQTEHHLKAFARFDATGRSGPSWNGPAALLTFNWLIYRRLWRMAALYLLLLALGSACCVWAWGRWPDGVTLGLVTAVVAVATVVPGLFADAWLHGQLRLALIDRVRQAPSMADAVAALRQRAPSWRRLRVMGVVNLLLLVAVLAGWQRQGGEPAHRPAMAVATPAPVPLAQPLASPEPPAPTEPPPPTVQSVSEPIALDPPGGYGLNVGLFADPANAQRTLARIRQAGFPARSDTVQMERGPRTRVRAGPFASRAEADQAALRIHALGLEAQVFRQGASE